MNIKVFGRVTKGAASEFGKDKVLRLSAALAYYSIFSIAPLVIIIISVAGLLFGTEAVTGQVQAQLRSFLGDQAAQTVESMISAARKPSQSIMAAILGVATLLIGASGVFGQLQDALNTIWEVQPKSGRGILGVIKDRFLSMAMVLGTGFLLLISMVLSAALAAASGYLNETLGLPPLIAEVLNNVVSFLVITMLFAMIFKYLPDVKIKWGDVWVGAIFTAALFTLGKFLLGLYLGRASTASAYGAAGSLIIVLLWVYYSSVILFFGAEFTQVYARERGRRLTPTENAVPLTEEAREEQGIPHGEPARASSEKRDRAGKPKPPQRARPPVPAPAYSMAMAPSREAAQAWEHIPKGSEVIHDKPWPFLSAAVALGLATGWLFKGEWLGRKKTRS